MATLGRLKDLLIQSLLEVGDHESDDLIWLLLKDLVARVLDFEKMVFPWTPHLDKSLCRTFRLNKVLGSESHRSWNIETLGITKTVCGQHRV